MTYYISYATKYLFGRSDGVGENDCRAFTGKKLGMRFVDSDHEIESRTGATVSWIFEIEGEDSFRRREVETIDDLTSQKGVVLATGGGAVVHPENRKNLKARGTVIYLRASVNNILQRTMHDKNRPLLQTENRRQKIEELARQREKFYSEVADIIIDTGRPNVHAMIQTIMNQLANPDRKKNSFDRQKKRPNLDNKNDMHTQSNNTHLKVDLGERSYPIEIGTDLLKDVRLLSRTIRGKRACHYYQ